MIDRRVLLALHLHTLQLANVDGAVQYAQLHGVNGQLKRHRLDGRSLLVGGHGQQDPIVLVGLGALDVKQFVNIVAHIGHAFKDQLPIQADMLVGVAQKDDGGAALGESTH